MKIARVIGTLTLNRAHPALAGFTFRVVVPYTLDELCDDREPTGEEVVAVDQLGSGLHQRVALADGREAAAPFWPELKPVDAYLAALLDQLLIEPLDARTS